jgi:uncharacterized protein involved in exopolysaccharide biosynthesis
MAARQEPVGGALEAPDELSWSVLLAAARRHAWLLLVTPLVGGLLGFGASYLVEPKYRVEAVLLPQQGGAQQGLLGSLAGQLGGLASLAGVDVGGPSSKHEAIEVLRSRSLAEEFIRSRDLLPVLFRDDWDAERQEWQVSDVPTLADGVREFDRHVRAVFEDRRTGLVTLRVTWRDADTAADWANDLVRRANAHMRSRTVDETRRSLEFLAEKAGAEQSVSVREALFKIVESQYKSLTLASVREDFAFRVIDGATPPDPDDISQPRRALFAAVGGCLGLLFAGVVLLVAAGRRPKSNIS